MISTFAKSFGQLKGKALLDFQVCFFREIYSLSGGHLSKVARIHWLAKLV